MQPKWSTIFVTGGAGYIGSHCIVKLLEAGYQVIAIDNFVNSVNANDEAISLKRVEQITGKRVIFYKCDLLNKLDLEQIFMQHSIDCVIHFAAMKAVGESMELPLLYYQNNLIGSINLLDIMKKYHCHQMVYSSSCTVYGDPCFLPITEDHPAGVNIANVYGKTKYFVEEILKDISKAEQNWNIISLRYFNPVGAHPSGLIGEDPTKQFTNLMPYMAQVAMRKKAILTVFGGDYNTLDGTGIRDYVHVMDLASGHVAALEKLQCEHLRFKAYNLGTGSGTTVLQLIKAFEEANNVTIPYKIIDRREGDIVAMYANTDIAKQELKWTSKFSLSEMCRDFWKWQRLNPNGYKKESVELSGSNLCQGDQNANGF